jgi:hypothetical protein
MKMRFPLLTVRPSESDCSIWIRCGLTEGGVPTPAPSESQTILRGGSARLSASEVITL